MYQESSVSHTTEWELCDMIKCWHSIHRIHTNRTTWTSPSVHGANVQSTACYSHQDNVSWHVHRGVIRLAQHHLSPCGQHRQGPVVLSVTEGAKCPSPQYKSAIINDMNIKQVEVQPVHKHYHVKMVNTLMF